MKKIHVVLLAILAMLMISTPAQAKTTSPFNPTKEKTVTTAPKDPNATVRDRTTPNQNVGSTYAFAVAPVFESSTNNATPPVTTIRSVPGYIQINAVDGVIWYLEGDVVAPGIHTFPAGIQAQVYAKPKPGYTISAGAAGSEQNPYFLEVLPQRKVS